MTKHEAVTLALIQYTGKRVVCDEVRLHPGSLRNQQRPGYSEGEEWAVSVRLVEDYVVYLRHGVDGWFVFQDEIEEVEFKSWPPRKRGDVSYIEPA